MVRSEGLEPPRFYSLPPQGSASTNSATSALETGLGIAPDRINGAGCNKSGGVGQGLRVWRFLLPASPPPRPHFLFFYRATGSVCQDHTPGAPPGVLGSLVPR